MNTFIQQAREAFSRDFTEAGLKLLIIAWSLFMILLAIVVDNKWLLAGILAYEVLP